MNPTADDQARIAELLIRWEDGELGPAETEELIRILQSDPSARRQLTTHFLLNVGIVRGLQTGAAAATLGLPPAAPNPARRWPRWLRPLAVAAGVALAVAGGLWLYPRLAGAPALGLQIATVAGKCSVFSVQGSGGPSASPAAGGVPTVVGMELRQGDRVVVQRGGTAALKYDGEATRIELHGATATFRAEQGAKRVRLDSGLLVCTAAPQQQPFQLATPHAVAEVVGTRFSLDVATTTTTLAVQEGKVSLSQGAKTLAVGAGETAVALPQALKMAAAAGPEPPTAPGRIRLNFDFEDGVTGSEWEGRLVQGPPRPSNRYCMEASAGDRGIRLVTLRDKANGLFTYRPGMAISFDYWAGEEVDAIDVFLWDRNQQASMGCEPPIYKPARGRWTHVRRDLQEFTGRDDLRLQDGSLVIDLTIQTNADGGQLFVDNVAIEMTDVGSAPGKGGRK